MANEVVIKIRADDEASKTFGRVKAAADKMGGAIRAASKVGAVAIAGLAVGAVKMASDFQTSFTEVTTLFDAPQKQIDALREGVLDLSATMGLDAVETTKALYQAISAGVAPAEALRFIEENARLAIGGVTDLSTAVDLTTTVINAFGLQTKDTAKVSDLMFTAVRLGKTTVSELGEAMFNVAPVAGAMGVSVEQTAAALAALTAQGVPTTVATTQLRQAILSLTAPTKRQSALMKELGLSFDEDKLQAVGLAGAFQEMIEAADGDAETLRRLVGSTEALQAVLALGGDQSDVFIENLRQMDISSGATNTAFEKMNKTFGRQFDILKSQLKVGMIELGSRLLPLVTQALEKLTPWLRENIPRAIAALENAFDKAKPFVRAFATGLDTLKPVAEALFKFIVDNKPVLVAAIIAIGVAILLAFGPGAVAIAAIVGLIALIGFMRDHFSEILDWFKSHWPEIALILAGPFGVAALLIIKFRDDIIAVFQGLLQRSLEIFGDMKTRLTEVVRNMLNDIVGFFIGLPGRIVDALAALPRLLFEAGKDAIKGFIDGFLSIPIPLPDIPIPGLPDLPGLPDIPGIPGWAHGGVVPGPVGRPQLAVVHGGETITPADGGGFNNNVWGTQNLVLPNVRDTRDMMREMDRLVR